MFFFFKYGEALSKKNRTGVVANWVTRTVCEKIAQHVAQPIFIVNINTQLFFPLKKSSLKIWATL
jgi:hypothetical protein